MLRRSRESAVSAALDRQAAVALLGPRQVGKTTLAHSIAEGRASIYLDLERPADKAKLTDPEAFLALHEDKLVILDEIHHVPELFSPLRGIIDQGRRKGLRTGRFLMLGSAAIQLMRQSETLAGRIAYVDLGPLNAREVLEKEIQKLWVRGGFPDSFLAATDSDSLAIRHDFIRTYLERDVPMFGPRVPAETLERLWTMLAHSQGGLYNASKLAAAIGISSPTVTSYLGLLVDLLLVRRLRPFHHNIGKRLVKSPKVYLRDSGLLHALLGIHDLDTLFGHPVIGASWEGFVIENLIASAPENTAASFYRTSAGAEIDLVLELGGKHGTWSFEIKRSLDPRLNKGNLNAIHDLNPAKSFVVYPGDDRFPLGKQAEAIGLAEMMQELESLR